VYATVEMLSRSMSTATPTSPRSWLPPATPVQNSAYKPNKLSTPMSSSKSVPGGGVDSSERSPPSGSESESGSIWVHVGVGIAALVIVIVIGILVSNTLYYL